MNLKRLMNETLIANNGEISRGIKNQLSLLSAFLDTDLDNKLDYLKQTEIPIYSYTGLRILEFNLENIQKVLDENSEKLDTYRTNPQELVRDLRYQEITSNKVTFEFNGMGGI